jgi:hypothetical protein
MRPTARATQAELLDSGSALSEFAQSNSSAVEQYFAAFDQVLSARLASLRVCVRPLRQCVGDVGVGGVLKKEHARRLFER